MEELLSDSSQDDSDVSFQIFTKDPAQMTVSWPRTPCRIIRLFRRCGRCCSLHRQRDGISVQVAAEVIRRMKCVECLYEVCKDCVLREPRKERRGILSRVSGNTELEFRFIPVTGFLSCDLCDVSSFTTVNLWSKLYVWCVKHSRVVGRNSAGEF